jgi:putative ABC transport system substrate-binding protein
MKNYKKLLAAAMAASLAMFTLAGCGSGSGTSGGGSADTGKTDSGDTYKVGIVQLTEHKALDAATKGFQDALKDKLGDKVEFDLQNAQGEQTNCATISSGFVTDGVDLIMANATPALQAAAAATNEIPILGTSVTDYASALDISDWNGKTGKNISGTSDLAPLEQQAAMIKEIKPDAQQVALLYCSSEANSKYQIENIEKELDKLGLAYKEYSAADSNEVQSVVTKASTECDVAYIPTDNVMADNTGIIDNILKPAKIPVVAGEQSICSGCGAVTLSIDYYDLGYATGEQAYEILVNGKDPGEMEIETAKDVTKLYNADNCAAIGIEAPEGYQAIEKSE